ncbi:hypothetical protein FocnCong_v016563 [Fusarium oxysporum f. sp. conglutinans]|nr:hypothetical protein FocnCong_v016563 [Fusarium oxysporum f. sp. conglutinans]
MSQVIVDHQTRAEITQIQTKGLTLFDTLYNSLVLRHTLPYLPVSGLLNLAATCRDIRYLLHETPGVFRHIDLTRVKTAHCEGAHKETERNLAVWHNVTLSDYLTEDDFYAGPLRGIFSTLRQRDILRDVQSLILDGLSVTAELCHEIMDDWAQCMLACQSLISFDAVLCQGPRHASSPAFGSCSVSSPCSPAVATFSVGGCAGCGKAPEGVMTAETHCSSLPLLAPPPILSSSVQAATTPRPGHEDFVPRCADCLRDRFCVACNKWWCETCYHPFGGDDVKRHVSRSCWECGINCNDCIERTQKFCKKCGGGYCLIHNEGSSSAFCDWCFCRGRGLRRV